MERTIRVTGRGRISVKPDRIQLMLTSEGVKEKYEEALELHAAQAEALKNCFSKLDFEKNALKTTAFHIDTEYENYRNTDNTWKKCFAGYKFVHSMKLEFDADNELLGKVLYALAHCEVKPEFSINYTIKDKEAAKNTLLAKAIEDSKEKAKVLAEAAGVKLCEIQTIDYSWEEVDFVSSPMSRMALAAVPSETNHTECYDLDIEADDIEISDTVTVIWSLA